MSSAKLPAPHDAGQYLAGELRTALATYPAASDQERCQFYGSFIAAVFGQLIAEVGFTDAAATLETVAKSVGEAAERLLHSTH
ncbi:hypothetical protein AA0N74_07980 [Chromobacterium vaccinii]|uniref:hypothetical protein n=1 Tax=Chromobacterium vaccinii TaxID=1108595 RepID=UPI0031DDA04D